MEISNFNIAEIITFFSTLCLILGHNLWLVGKNEKEGKTKIKINTGDDFPSSDSAVKTERIAGFKVLSANGEQRISNFTVEGKSLTAIVEETPKMAFVAGIELLPHPITLEADRFAHYVEDEDAQDFTSQDFVIGKSLKPQRESYSKFAKVFVENNADDLLIFTKKIGHKFEIVLLALPAKDKKILPVQILFEGKPVKNLRVSSGAENLNGGRYSFETRTNENGFADVEIPETGHCFVRTHLIRRHSDTNNFEWESFWASITFRI